MTRTPDKLEVSRKLIRRMEKLKERLPDQARANSNGKDYFGSERIRIELPKKPELAEKYVQVYEDLVTVMANTLRYGFSVKSNEEKRFIQATWKTTYVHLGMRYGNTEPGTMWRTLKTNKLDCDLSAFLYHDVAQTLGLKTELVSAPGHVFLKTSGLSFETTEASSPGYFRLKEMPRYYLVEQVSDRQTAQESTYRNLALCYAAEKKYSEAIDLVKKAVEISAKPQFASLLLASLYAEKRDNARAFEIYDKLLTDFPKFVWPRLRRGELYLKTKDYEKAEVDFSKLLKLWPQYYIVHADMGSLNFRRHNFQKATENYSSALDILHRLGQLKKLQIPDYISSIKLYLNRAVCHAATLRLPKAVLDLVLALRSTDAFLTYALIKRPFRITADRIYLNCYGFLTEFDEILKSSPSKAQRFKYQKR